MKTAVLSVLMLVCVLFIMVVLAGCPASEDEGGGNYACSYEERRTDGCDGYGFGSWESGCYDINADNYVISPEEVCDNLTDGGLWCEAGCCVDAQYQNVSLSSGSCP
jgi:hypothetical protein